MTAHQSREVGILSNSFRLKNIYNVKCELRAEKSFENHIVKISYFEYAGELIL